MLSSSKLIKEWHPSRNTLITPNDVSDYSHLKVWWLCVNKHEWAARISDRSRGGKCPYCLGKIACKDHCLQQNNPSLAAMWHPGNNDLITPSDVTPKSGKAFWWKCEKGHEWKMSISAMQRSFKSKSKGCPYCAGRRVDGSNSLASRNPTLARIWHPTKNEKLTPHEVTSLSSKKVWWQCIKGHAWKASIAAVTYTRRDCGTEGCPYCYGRVASSENNLAVAHPEVAAEWHPIKNKPLTPYDVSPNSHKMVWWMCPKGHESKSTVKNRNKDRKCPYCSGYKTSLREIRIYAELKYLFKNVQHRAKINGIECDIYIPSIRLGIEYDGSYWHKDKFEQDKKKTDALSSKGYRLIRLREQGLKKITSNDLIVKCKEVDVNMMHNLAIKIFPFVSLHADRAVLAAYIKDRRIRNQRFYQELHSILPGPLPGESIAEKNINVTQEWNKERNGKLTPSRVSANSHMKVWWKCKAGHEWQSSVAHRNNGRGCPYCSGKKASEDYNLQVVNPELAKQWHPIKNASLTPKNVTPNSHHKVWWICEKRHEWQASISNRNKGRGCFACYTQRRNRGKLS